MRKYFLILIQVGLILLVNCLQSTSPVTPQKSLDDYNTQYRMLVRGFSSLFTVNSDGTNETEILNYEGYAVQEATVNNDFSKIAFAATFDESPHNIYIMNIDGSDLRKLSNHPNQQGNLTPRFLPNEQALIYHAYDDLRKVSYDGSVNEQITPDSIQVSGQSSSVSHNKIVFTANAVFNDTLFTALGIMNTDGSDLQYFLDGKHFYNPSISPDGTKVCYIDRQDVHIMNLDGTEKMNLTNDPSNDLFPVWTPDGSKISFISNMNGDYHIYIIDPDGDNLRKIPNISEKTPFYISCSPDLTRIAYAAFTNDPHLRDTIYIVDIETGDRMRLMSGIGNPVWLNIVQ